MSKVKGKDGDERDGSLGGPSVQGIAVLQDWRIIYANSALSEISGYDREELYAMSPERTREAIYAEDRKLVETRYRDRVSGAPVVPRYEFRIRRKDGAVRWVALHSVRIEHEGRQAIQIAILDITEQKKAGEELRESEAKYAMLVERAHDGVFIIQDGVLKFANKATGAMLGCEASSLLEQNFLDFVAPEHREELAERYRKRIAGEEVPSVYESKLLGCDGRVVPVEISASTITYKGRPAAMGVMRDIHERLTVEEELARAQKLESLGHLAGGIAHDFNNVLMAIQGNIDLARMNLADAKLVMQNLDNAERAVKMARDISQQLLTFSRGGDPVKRLVSTAEIVRDAAELTVTGSSVMYELSIQDDLWDIEADPGQISQVMSNIIMNALQSMTSEGNVAVSAENTTLDRPLASLRPGRYIKITVKDKGTGIPEDILPRIFDPYFTTKRTGNGLGLTTAYSIVKKHRGHISVESREGKGTTVTVLLPASDRKAPAEDAAASRIVRGGGRVLLMDDEDIVRGAVGKLISRLGYEVSQAKSGAEAVELYGRALEGGTPFDVVILDLTVPGGMGGKEALNRLLEIDREVKAVVSSGYSNDPIISDYKKYGFAGVIVKPYSIENLSSIIERLVRNSKNRRPRASPRLLDDERSE